MRISADGVGSISGRLLLGTAEVIPPEELIDTTGAGDAFIGAVLYGQYACSPFSCQIAEIVGCFVQCQYFTALSFVSGASKFPFEKSLVPL